MLCLLLFRLGFGAWMKLGREMDGVSRRRRNELPGAATVFMLCKHKRCISMRFEPQDSAQNEGEEEANNCETKRIVASADWRWRLMLLKTL
ncbi:hypothetical protein BGZ60DRAFT_421346 [Tricladium varicosporioides]|nr:hypothetical protein BGZ60DRAFT_421346 [Hymenoscyphus varicosporioides]